MADNKRNMPSVKSFEDFFKKYKIDGYITADDLPDLSPYATSGDLDNYVKTADIVNDLASVDTDKPLSAKMGSTLAGLSLYADDPYGSNSNGTYIKFTNGIMVCFNALYFSSAAFTATGSVYYRQLGATTFPATFASTPTVTTSISMGNYGSSQNTPTATGLSSMGVMSAVSQARSITYYYIAIGWWE